MASIEEYLCWAAENKTYERLRSIRLYLNHIRRLCADEPIEDLIAARIVSSLTASSLSPLFRHSYAYELRTMMT